MSCLVNQCHALSAILFGLFLALTAGWAQADIADFSFELAQSELKAGDSAIVEVRLRNKRTGATVPDAVIFANRLDMAPDGMADMTTPLEALPPTPPGTYRFRTNLTMPGRWQLSLAAKVQGETGSLDTKLLLTVLP